MSYFKKSHQHKPKKGKGSYDRKASYFNKVKKENFRASSALEGIKVGEDKDV